MNSLRPPINPERSVKLSIPHIFGQAVADVDIGQAGHAAPEGYVVRRHISRSVQMTGQEVADGFPS